MTYTAQREDLLAHARDLFEVVQNGKVTIAVARPTRSPKPRAPTATWKGRKTTGSSVFTV